jgi:spore maturation protein CgeB
MDILHRNLAALRKRSPDLAQRLCLPVASDHVRLPAPGQDQPPAYRHHRSWLPLQLGTAAVQELLGERPDGALLLLGLGLGELLHAALDDPRFTTVLAWDRDPWLLRLCLAQRDLSQAIATGRLQLALSSDLLELLPWESGLLPHPLCERIYPWELHLMEGTPGPRRALLATGELFVDDLAEALRGRGYTVLPLELTRHAREELLWTARASGAELVVSINYTHGLAELCTELGLPLLCWEIDPSTDQAQVQGPVETAHIFSYRQACVEEYRQAGFPSVRYLPLATNPARRFPPPPPIHQRHEAAISFVGSSMVAASMAHRQRFQASFQRWKGAEQPAPAQAVLQRILQVQRSDFTRNQVPALVDGLCPGWRAWARQQRLEDPAMLAGEIAAAEKRLNTVASLGSLGVKAWGDDGWKLAARAGVQPMGRAGHGREINAIYAGSTINLDIARLYQPDIATMRIFDVMACGGFVLAEHNEAVAALFEPGRELDTWRDLDQLRAKVDHYLAHPEQARAIAQAGRERVLADHTIAQRLDDMLALAGLG